MTYEDALDCAIQYCDDMSQIYAGFEAYETHDNEDLLISDVFEMVTNFLEGLKTQAQNDAWPFYEDRFYYIDPFGNVIEDIWFESEEDEDLKKAGNIFHTLTEAEATAKKVKELLLGEKL